MADEQAVALDLERLRMGVAVSVSDSLARSLKVEAWRDPMLRHTQYAIEGWFASRKVFEEERTIQRVLSWRERLRALIGKPIDVPFKVEMRRNCPHLNLPDRDHIAFLAASATWGGQE